jgi:hypothetical protein
MEANPKCFQQPHVPHPEPQQNATAITLANKMPTRKTAISLAI